MARKTDIRLRRSNTAGAVPSGSNLNEGELAINTADGALYFRKSDSTIITAHDNTIMHIDSTNNRVGIGTTSPDKTLDVLGDIRSINGSQQHQLRANQIISYGVDAILNAQSAGDDVLLRTQSTTRLIATAEGNIGIGTETPAVKLSVDSGTSDFPAHFKSTDNKAAVIIEDDTTTIYVSAENSRASLGMQPGLHANNLNVMNTGYVGIGTSSPARRLTVQGSSGDNLPARFIGGANTTHGSIEFQDPTTTADYKVIIGSKSDDMYFQSGGNEKARLTSGGFLGIGTGNIADTPIHVYRASGISGIIPQLKLHANTSDNTGTQGSSIDFVASSDPTAVGSRIIAARVAAGAHQNLKFHTARDTFAMIIDENQNVGIGTSAPAGNLHIKSIGNIGDAKLIIEADADNNVESDNPRIELRQDSNLVSGSLYLEGNAGTTATNTIDNALVLDSKGALSNQAIQFATGGQAAAQAGGETNSNVAMTILGSGSRNVGIGTTAPSAALHIASTTANATGIGFQNSSRYYAIEVEGGGLRVKDVSAGLVERFRIASDGRVGIGTSSPSTNLTVVQSGVMPTSGFSNTQWVGAFVNTATTTSIARVGIYSGNNTDALLNFGDADDADIGGLSYSNAENSLAIRTNNAEHMRIKADGKVGIGTTTPAFKLHVVHTTTPVAKFEGSTNAYMDFSDGTVLTRIQNSGGLFIGTETNHNLSFKTNGSVKMTVRANGHVGIGQSAPRDLLDIVSTTSDARLILDAAEGFDPELKFFEAGSVKFTVGHDATTSKFVIGTSNVDTQKRFTIDTSGAITFNEAYTFPTSIGAVGQILKVPATGTVLVWGSDAGGGSANLLTDGDGDTKIQVEESIDEDIIRFDVAGSEVAQMTEDGIILADGLDVEATEFIGDLRGSVLFKAQAGEALSKGDVVTITGISGNTTVVSKADADDASLMPAFGVAAETVIINAPVDIYSFGIMSNLTTNINGWTEGSPLYVSTTPGEMTDVPPSGSTSLVQQIAKITKIHASTGSIDITGAGRANATPNLDEGKIFVGNSSNRSVQVDDTIHVDMANSRVGINTASPTHALQVAGDIRIDAGNALKLYNSAGNGWAQIAYNNTLDHIEVQRSFQSATDSTQNLGSSAKRWLNTYSDNFVGDTLSIGNITATGYLRGPASFVIDPAAHGDDTGTVVIAGNLQVDGTTTTINSTTLTIDDKNITLASGAADAAAANGAGLTVDGANATWTYSSGDDAWASNKHAQFYTGGATGTLSVGRTSDQAIRLYADDNYNKIFAFQDSDTDGDHFFDLVRSFQGTGKADMRFMSGTAVHAVLDKAGNFGINTAAPSNKLEVNGIASIYSGLRLGSSSSGEGIIRHGGPTANGIGITTGALSSPNIKLFVAHANDGGGVGIGTTAPAAKLHVKKASAGTTHFDGYATAVIEDTEARLQIISDDGGNNASSILLSNETKHWAIMHQGPLSNNRFSIGYDLTTATGTDIVNTSSHILNITTGGNVGIGTTSPERALHVVGGIHLPNNNIISWDQADGTLRNAIYVDSGDDMIIGDTNFDDIYFSTGQKTKTVVIKQTTGNVGIGTSSPLSNLHVNAGSGGGVTLEANANVDIDFRYRSGGVNKYNVAYDASAGSLIWYDNTANATRMVLDSSGNVGIGTNSPNANFQVLGPASATVPAAGSGAVGGSIFSADLNTYGMFIGSITSGVGYIQQQRTNTATYYGLALQPNGGNVGIGTTSPPFKLSVEGPAQVRDYLRITNTGGSQKLLMGNQDSSGVNNPAMIVAANGHLHLGGGTNWSTSGGTFTGHLTVNDNGKVGIGDSPSNPQSTLHVSSPASDGSGIRVSRTGSSGYLQIYPAYSGIPTLMSNNAGLHLGYNSNTAGIRIHTGNKVGVNQVAPKASFQVEEYGIDTTTSSTAATTQVAIHTFPIADFRSARFTIQITNSTDSTYHSTEILAIHDGTTANITEFGEVHTGSSVEATFDADVSSGNFRLLATPTSTNSMEFKVVCHSLTI